MGLAEASIETAVSLPPGAARASAQIAASGAISARLAGLDGGSLRVLDSLPSAVLVASPEGRIRYVNDRGVAILSRERKELEGRDLDEVLGSGAALEITQTARAERVIRLPNGSERTLGLTAAPLNGSGNVVLVFQDVSNTIALREERDKLLRIAAIGEALPSLLHELKNPLAAVTTAVEVLVEEVDGGDVATQLHAVLSELRRMALSFDGIGAVHRPLTARRHAAIDYACVEACRVLQPRATNAGVSFRWIVRDMPLLPIDPGVVRALVFNFVTNAIHASERGGAIRLEARLTSGGQNFLLSVVDTGAGMSPEILERATQLFYTTKVSGSGIGLALCCRVIEEAGGEMALRSVPGFGTSVTVTVPVVGPAVAKK